MNVHMFIYYNIIITTYLVQITLNKKYYTLQMTDATTVIVLQTLSYAYFRQFPPLEI